MSSQRCSVAWLVEYRAQDGRRRRRLRTHTTFRIHTHTHNTATRIITVATPLQICKHNSFLMPTLAARLFADWPSVAYLQALQQLSLSHEFLERSLMLVRV